MHQLRIMDQNGDRTVTWNPQDEDALRHAMREFDNIRRQGYMVVRPGEDGGKPTAITRFDATAPELVAIPAIVGG